MCIECYQNVFLQLYAYWPGLILEDPGADSRDEMNIGTLSLAKVCKASGGDPGYMSLTD